MIKPINSHVIVEPVEHQSFMSTQKESYEEIGVVKDFDKELEPAPFNIGDKVYFDSWLCAKYPTGDGKGFYWLVKFEDIRAYEQVSE